VFDLFSHIKPEWQYAIDVKKKHTLPTTHHLKHPNPNPPFKTLFLDHPKKIGCVGVAIMDYVTLFLAEDGDDNSGQRTTENEDNSRTTRSRDWYGESNTAESGKSSDDVSFGGLCRNRDTGSVSILMIDNIKIGILASKEHSNKQQKYLMNVLHRTN